MQERAVTPVFSRLPVPDPTPVLKLWASWRRAVLDRQDPVSTQRRTLARLLRSGRRTEFGKAHGFASIRSVEDYRRQVPLRLYEAFWREWWEPRFPYVGGATWPGRIRYFANSSGTTQASTKRIPLSAAMLRSNGRAALDVLAWHFARRPDSKVLGGTGVFLGGSTALETLAPGIRAGDLSGVAAARQPLWARGRVLPRGPMARVTDWRAKMSGLAPAALCEPVASISGTASWMLLFLETAAALRPPGARLRDLFPALELLVHGGVGFAPYRDRFAWFLEGGAASTREVYAASEGFIAVADRGNGEGLRLVLDRGLFFEFVRPADLDTPNPERRCVGDAELEQDYALVLTTDAGLWSYVLGDVVRLVSLDPPRVLVTGRTSWSLSVAGEHLSGSELDTAVSQAARTLGRGVVDYSAAPLPPGAVDPRGGHLFAVELDGPCDATVFAEALDAVLRCLNDDYAAHRGDGFGLRDPDVQLLPPGSFARWMEGRGKLGGQNKVPRVVTGAEALKELLAI
jgi:hypothetical protein